MRPKNNDKQSTQTKEKVIAGLFWSFCERIAAQGVSFVLSVILARILMPEEYGIIAIVIAFINIANIFTSGGFGEALVQKKDADETDYSTMFFCTLLISLVIYFSLFIISPSVAVFFRTPQIKWVLRVLALKIVISSLTSIQHAYIQKKMIFKKFFLSTLVGTLISGLVGIVMAKIGFGVWALVTQYLLNTVMGAIVLLFTVPWHPQLKFSKESASKLLDFGWKMVLANLVNGIYNELRSIVIGRKFSSSDLAFYNKGNQIPALAITNIDTSIANVVFPAMADAESHDRLKSIGRRVMKTTSYIIFPAMIGLIIVSEPLIILLLTEKWRMSVFYMQVLCVYWMTQPIQTANWQMIKAMGRSDLCLKLEVIKKIIGILLIIGSMFINVKAIAFSAAIFGVVSMFINIIPNAKLVGYSVKEQLGDIMPALLSSIAMGAMVYMCSFIPLPTLVVLIIQVIVGIFVYVALSVVFKIESFKYILKMVQTKLK